MNRSSLLPICLLFCTALGSAQPRATDKPVIFASFDAVSGDPDMIYKDHPDMALAACSGCGSAGQVLVATGQDVAVYDTSGKLLKTQRTRDFIKAAGIDPDLWKSKPALPAQAAGRVNDPRASYDPFIGRWIVVCSCSGDFLMVSAGKDATGLWKGVALTDSAGDLTMFPGWDKNGVYISEFQPKLNSQVIALPAEDVAWSRGGNISLAHEGIFRDRAYEMRPVIDPSPTKHASDPEYLIARSGPPQNGKNVPLDLLVDQVAWSKKRANISGPANIPTEFLYNAPKSMPQPSGSPIRGNESHRVFSASAYGGRLDVIVGSGGCTADCGAQGHDVHNLFYWFQLNPKTMALTRKVKVAEPALSLLFPTMAVNGSGDIGVGLTGGSDSQWASIYLFTHLNDEPADKMNGPFLAQSGTERYSCDKGPAHGATVGWGTYSATVQDGSDPMKLWTLQEYAGSATQCAWKTRVIGFRVSRR